MGNHHADADTALRVPLTHRVNHHHMLRDAQGKGAHIGFSAVIELPVHLVGEEEKVVLYHRFLDLLQLFRRIDIAGGVGRIAQQDGLGPGGDRLLESLYRRQGKAVFDGGRYRLHHHARRLGKGDVVGVAGLHHNDLVPGIEAGHEAQKNGLGATRRDNHLFGAHLQAKTPVVARKLGTETQKTIRGAVLQGSSGDGLEGIQTLLRSG